MTCLIHDAQHPCPFCEWASSGDAVKARPAARRAARVAGGPPPVARPTPATPARAGPFAGKIRASLWGMGCYFGGAESWMDLLVRTTSDRVEWVGMAVTGGSDPAALAKFAAIMPTHAGTSGVAALARSSEVAVTWGVKDATRHLPSRRPPKVVSVSHAPAESKWGDWTFCGEGVSAIVAVSESAREGVPGPYRESCRVVANAVDPARLNAARARDLVRASWGVPPGAKVAGYLGRMSKEKRPHLLPGLARSLPAPWRVVAVGDGPEITGLRDGPANLHAVGPDADAGSVLNAFDVLVVPSEYESYGLTIVEGWWAGVPVVATPVGVAGLNPGLSAVLPADPSPQDIAAAVLASHGEADRPRRAKEWAMANASPERFGREWGDLIVSLGKAYRAEHAPKRKLNVSPGVARALDCVYRECKTGCKGTLCHWRAGKPSPNYSHVTLADCLDCLKAAPAGGPPEWITECGL